MPMPEYSREALSSIALLASRHHPELADWLCRMLDDAYPAAARLRLGGLHPDDDALIRAYFTALDRPMRERERALAAA